MEENQNQSNEASQVEVQARLENKVHELRSELYKLRTEVRGWFQGCYEDSDFDDYFYVNVEDINNLLGKIGASQLERVFEGTVTLEISFKVHAEDRDEAEAIIESNISDFALDDGISEMSVDSSHIEFND